MISFSVGRLCPSVHISSLSVCNNYAEETVQHGLLSRTLCKIKGKVGCALHPKTGKCSMLPKAKQAELIIHGRNANPC